MARSPNQEQVKAINHHGGVLLSAGAGSGKTFVLVEHIIYLIQSFHQQNSLLSAEHLQLELKRYLSQIVLMTFTKKAAGELSLRLKKRLDQQCLACPDQELWISARECIGVMTVSTIHGLCHKLLTSGEIPDFDPELVITSEIDLRFKLEQLFQSWYQSLDEEVQQHSTTKTFVANREALLTSLLGIFSAPELRLMWKNVTEGQLLGNDASAVLADCYKLLEIDGLMRFGTSIPDNSSKAKWPAYLQAFNQLLNDASPFMVENLEKYSAFFVQYKGIRAPAKDSGFDETILQMEKMKIFREFVQEHLDSLNAFVSQRDAGLKEWGALFKQIVDYIETHYRSIPGFNFSDLEYYLMLALEDPQVVQRLARDYRYFIIDEFQDTSYIQYHLIEKLIEGDFSRLFCVGDKKQAIYGFRGGELGVFDQCAQQIPLNLGMSNNYRSAPRIIDFNNSLFHFLFTKGMGFSGDDPFAVEVLPQLSPLEVQDEKLKGSLLSTDIVSHDDLWKRFSSAQAGLLEAQFFADSIESLLQQDPKKTIAVLYSKLAPSRYLIALLIERGIAFTAQIKVPLSSDPILSVFKILLQVELTRKQLPDIDYWKYCQLLFEGHFHYLQMNLPDDLRQIIEQWHGDLPLFGLEQSTKNFFYKMGLHNSNHANNAQLIGELCRLSQGDIDRCYALLETNSEGTYSIEFQQGDAASRVQLMTVHASKGLEFDDVFLAGINTNGVARSNSNYFGKNPGSFKWKQHSAQKKTFQTPEYILEHLITKRKEFAESKRLFYVACTRAIHGLHWIDLQNQSGAFSSGDNSWIDGLRKWADTSLGNPLVLHLGENRKKIICDQQSTDQAIEKLSIKSPLFHLDPLGLTQRMDRGSLGILSELSVTRLSTLVECPRKFYLKNICKIDERSLAELESDWELVEEKEIREERLLIGEQELEQLPKRSSGESVMARGTEIHAAIEQFLKTEEIDTRYLDQINFVKSELDHFKKTSLQFDMFLEQPIKFPLFGQVINGIPDLLLLGESAQIWDYKTGRRHQDKEHSYWFQLRCYAYALYRQQRVAMDKSTTMVLLYVDSGERVERVEDFAVIENELFVIWRRSAQLDHMAENCQFCSYQNLCH